LQTGFKKRQSKSQKHLSLLCTFVFQKMPKQKPKNTFAPLYFKKKLKMVELKEKPTLGDLQKYTQKVCEENGWDKASHLQTWLLFTEEVGELAKAIRNRDKLYQEKPTKGVQANLEEEFADVLSYVFHLANDCNVDLEKAFRAKEAVNAARTWK
jgi:NTP pyrophosphatase (non-canonical NTP hydrolase)